GGEQTALAAAAGVDVEPLVVGVEVERQVIGGLDGAEEGDVASLTHPAVGEVDGVAERAGDADTREAAAWIVLDVVVHVAALEDLVAHPELLAHREIDAGRHVAHPLGLDARIGLAPDQLAVGALDVARDDVRLEAPEQALLRIVVAVDRVAAGAEA